MTEIQLRYATASDVDAFDRAFRSVIEPLDIYNEWARRDELEKYSPDHVAEYISERPKAVLLAVAGDEVAGFLSTRIDDGLIWLSWFGVVEKHRGQKIGSKMISRMLHDAKNDGYWKIWCDTRVDNVQSIPLLQAAGFLEKCRLIRHWYGQDFIIWEKFVE